MPNKLTNWDEVTKRGNPIRRAKLNTLIKLMIKMEVAYRGMLSQAHWALPS